MLLSNISSIKFAPEKLEQFLSENGITQAELNENAGFVNPNTINKIINKRRKVTGSELLKIATVLNVPAETFSDY